ncbi:MAG: glycoside hydrolase family 88 protein [Bacteroidales bacterium]|nr:glycoside hydrolase family 88 protein [Bacteroidales bacterium]
MGLYQKLKIVKSIVFISVLFISGCNWSQTNEFEPIEKVIDEALHFSARQSLLMANSLLEKDGLLPKTADRYGNLETCNPEWWVSGFFPGLLWYMYEFTKDDKYKQLAHSFSMRVADQQYFTTTHDLGFIIFCSFGNGYRLTGDSSYLKIIETASCSLVSRFRESTGCIRSWDPAEWNSRWEYPVIIDNMMNLEMLLWACHQFNENRFCDVAITHANTTLKNHFRPDNSSYHVVSYDTVTGLPECKNTAQGYGNESSWARGQAWGLYGFTMAYRYTGDTIYLNQAKRIAGFLLDHPRLPADKIPYWDFDAPNIPDCYRDASAACIICSALTELSQYVIPELSEEYLNVAETQIRTLNSPHYRNTTNNNGNFILKHSVGHMPDNSEVDVPLTYADYYFVEALIRMKKLRGSE